MGDVIKADFGASRPEAQHDPVLALLADLDSRLEALDPALRTRLQPAFNAFADLTLAATEGAPGV